MTIAFDTETFPTEPGNKTPRVVCISYASERHPEGEIEHAIKAKSCFFALADRILKGWDTGQLVGANTAYDMACMWAHAPDLAPLIWELYDSGRVSDVLIRQKILDIAAGLGGWGAITQPDCSRKRIKLSYNLDECMQRHFGIALDKDTWRLRYGELYEVPLHEWPADARQYPVDDAVATLAVYNAQEPDVGLLMNEASKCRTAWMLHLMSCYGIRTDPEAVAAFEKSVYHSIGETQDFLERVGLVRANGSRDTKAAKAYMLDVCAKLGREPVKTDKDDICLDDAACKATGDEVLIKYAEYSSLAKVVSTDIPILHAGASVPIQTRFDPLLETDRTSSSDPNIQNIKRLVGMRECFRPRPGFIYVDADYGMLELCTWAQVCLWVLGRSHMAEVLNSADENDPHLAFAAQILHISYAEARAALKAGDKEVKQRRLVAKVGNFGFPGGLGAGTFVEYAASSYKVNITEDQAKELKAYWLSQWPEARPYFDYIGSKGNGGEGRIAMQRMLYGPKDVRTPGLHGPGSWRSNMRYTVACNDPFQSLGATAATWAGYDLARACYYERNHILFGSRPVNFIHDQYLVEIPDDSLAPERAQAVADVMVNAARRACPDVTPKVAPALCRMWSKDAEPRYTPEGRLTIWEPS
jgi:DNA polymerase-1